MSGGDTWRRKNYHEGDKRMGKATVYGGRFRRQIIKYAARRPLPSRHGEEAPLSFLRPTNISP